MSELFGDRALELDKFSLTIGFKRAAEEAFANMDKHSKDILQAYADGVNDFVTGINLLGDSSTAKLLPPEFYAIGHKMIRPWTPVDSLSIIKILNFHLSWNWNQDLFREEL